MQKVPDMKIIIDYHEHIAYVDNAFGGDLDDPSTLKEFTDKYIRQCLHKRAKADGLYGLEFWKEQNSKHPALNTYGHFEYSILDPFGRI